MKATVRGRAQVLWAALMHRKSLNTAAYLFVLASLCSLPVLYGSLSTLPDHSNRLNAQVGGHGLPLPQHKEEDLKPVPTRIIALFVGQPQADPYDSLIQSALFLLLAQRPINTLALVSPGEAHQFQAFLQDIQKTPRIIVGPSKEIITKFQQGSAHTWHAVTVGGELICYVVTWATWEPSGDNLFKKKAVTIQTNGEKKEESVTITSLGKMVYPPAQKKNPQFNITRFISAANSIFFSQYQWVWLLNGHGSQEWGAVLPSPDLCTLISWCNTQLATRGIFIVSCEATGTNTTRLISCLKAAKQYPLSFPIITQVTNDTIDTPDEYRLQSRDYEKFAELLTTPNEAGLPQDADLEQLVTYWAEAAPSMWGPQAHRLPHILTAGASSMQPLLRSNIPGSVAKEKQQATAGQKQKIIQEKEVQDVVHKEEGTPVTIHRNIVTIGVPLCLTRNRAHTFTYECPPEDIEEQTAWLLHTYLLLQSPYIPFPLDVTPCQKQRLNYSFHIVPSFPGTTDYALEELRIFVRPHDHFLTDFFAQTNIEVGTPPIHLHSAAPSLYVKRLQVHRSFHGKPLLFTFHNVIITLEQQKQAHLPYAYGIQLQPDESSAHGEIVLTPEGEGYTINTSSADKYIRLNFDQGFTRAQKRFKEAATSLGLAPAPAYMQLDTIFTHRHLQEKLTNFYLQIVTLLDAMNPENRQGAQP